MRKNYLFPLMFFCTLFTFSCNDEKDNIDYAKDITGSFKGSLSGADGQILGTQKFIVKSSSTNLVNITVNQLRFMVDTLSIDLGSFEITDIPTEPSAGNEIYILPKETTAGDYSIHIKGVVGEKLDLVLEVNHPDLAAEKVYFTGTKMSMDNEKTDAELTSVFFREFIVTAQPVISDSVNLLIFNVDIAANPEDLTRLAPVINVSEGATVYPPSEEGQDFSQGPVKYTVTAEDGIHQQDYFITYTKGSYDFENWIDTVYNQVNNTVYCQEVAGWVSSNPSAPYLWSFIGGGFNSIPVTSVENAKGGIKAALIQTLQTQDDIGALPYISAGLLFFGNYEFKLMNQPTNAKFGVVLRDKPVKFKGWYNYTPGTDYFVANANDFTQAYVDNDMRDSCLIIAVLYEIDDIQNDFLSFADLKTSDKIVLKAELENGSTTNGEWREFELDFTLINNKIYDSSKLYKFAVVCMSSRNGNNYSGAPKSTLIVDDFEIVLE